MDSNPTLAPAPMFPERQGAMYERKMGENRPGGRGPLRFEEGVATDTDIPRDFGVGMSQGYVSAPGRYNHNAKVDTKSAQETLQERAHVGSAAWIEAPSFLGGFAGGAGEGQVVAYTEEVRSGARYLRANPTVVND